MKNLYVMLLFLLLTLPMGSCDSGGTTNTVTENNGTNAEEPQTESGSIVDNTGSTSDAESWPYDDPTYTSLSGLEMQVISTDINKAYPEIEYDYRLAVRGGAFPYQFRLRSAPSGMTIDPRKGVLKWTAPAESADHLIQVDIKDSEGTVISHSFILEVTENGFYFIDPYNGDDAADGSKEHPIKSLSAIPNKGWDTDSYLYFAGGNYVFPEESIKMSDGYVKNWMALPGETPKLDCENRIYCIGGFMQDSAHYLFKGFEFYNSAFKYFTVDAGYKSIGRIRWRNNYFHDLKNTHLVNENPSFIFFQGGDKAYERSRESVFLGKDTIIDEYTIYKNMVIQDNVFEKMENMVLDDGSHLKHVSSSVWYSVHFSLFEDNIVTDVTDGFGVHDKDNGYFNTFRGNTFSNLSNANGVQISCQITCSDTEIDHNLITDTEEAIVVAFQGGGPFAKNFYMHHNTIINGAISTGGMIKFEESENYIFKHNLLKNSSVPFYSMTGSYDIDDERSYIQYLIDPNESKYTVNNNLLYNDNNYTKTVLWRWGMGSLDRAGMQEVNIDTDSVFEEPVLSADGTYSLYESDPYFGVYGKDILY